jgi:pilus assembly protein CpaC
LSFARVLIASAALLSAAPLAPPAFAQSSPSYGGVSRAVSVAVNKSAAFRLDGPVGEVVVAQPEIAQIVALTDQSFYVRGKALGGTNILIYDRSRTLVEVIDVHVGHDAAAIEADIAQAMPSEKIKVRAMGKGVMLTGEASTATLAGRARTIAERHVPAADIASSMRIMRTEQVRLEVRVLEASRNTLKELGVDLAIGGPGKTSFFSGTGVPGGSPQGILEILTNSGDSLIEAEVQALEEKGLLRTLARPNLTALSGETASFLAGGEFPIPVAASLDDDGRTRVGIEFKEFGVKLDFKPTVNDGGLIRLEVAPEVSQIDSRRSVRALDVEIPGLSVRRAQTVVELRDGESFAMAGLFQQEYNNAVRQLPVLGDLPVLGALFRSARWRRNETELVIIVTPRVVTPTPEGGPLPDPLAGGREPGDAAVFGLGRALDKPISKPVGAKPLP